MVVDVTEEARLLARLAVPTPSPTHEPIEGHVSVSELVERWRRNKVPLMAVERVAPSWMTLDRHFQECCGRERAWYETQRREYLLVRDAWLQRGIECLMIKSAGNPPAFPHTSDNIDVLVRPAHGLAARDALRGLGYVEVRNVEEPSKYLFRRFLAGECVSAIHVHEEVAWFVGFMDEDALWRRMGPSADDPSVNVPSPEDAVLINLAHACYENKELRLNDLLRIHHALRSAPEGLDWDYMVGVARSRGWSDGLAFMTSLACALDEALFGGESAGRALRTRAEALLAEWPAAAKRWATVCASGAASLPLDLGYWFCKDLYYRKILKDPSRPAAARWRDAGRTVVWGVRLKSRVRPQRGLSISLSGIDGSGKTTVAGMLTAALRLCEIGATYHWSRGGSTGLPRLVGAIVRRAGRGARSAPRSADEVAPHGSHFAGDPLSRRRQRLSHPAARLAWSWLVATDQIARDMLRVRLPVALGRVVVTDRYVYDTAVEMNATLPADARWSRLAIGAMLRLTPRPDLAYWLDSATSVVRERKPDEIWHASLEDEREAYGRLAARYGLRRVASDGAIADTVDPIIRECVMTFMARYETWLNAVFLYNPSQKNPPDPIWRRGVFDARPPVQATSRGMERDEHAADPGTGRPDGAATDAGLPNVVAEAVR